MKDGVIVVDKPLGMTSHDVVRFVRKKFKMHRVGHAGTLDPLATGVLILLIGKSTKLFNKFVCFDKAYQATLLLGVTTTTADIQGRIMREMPCEMITRPWVEEVFRKFTGEIQQIPPMVSAIKFKGERLYKLARRGLQVERQPRPVKINVLTLTDFVLPHVKFYLECSKGTYVRQLAEDVGWLLGCGACISQIERTRVGPFAITDAVKLENLNESHIRLWDNRQSKKTNFDDRCF